MPSTSEAKLIVKFEAETKRLNRELDATKKRLGKFERNTRASLAKVRGHFTGLLSGALLAGFTTAIVRATAKSEAVVKQLEAGLASTGGVVGRSLDELRDKAAELQKVTTFGDEDIIAGQAKLLTFTNIIGEQFDRTTEAALDLSTRMDQDLKSSIVQLGKALNDPIANLSALSRSGIQFSTSQKDTIKTLVESNRLMDAQDIILKELERQFGGSARAARDTFGGALTGLSNAFGDLLESTGGLPEAKRDLEKLTTLLQDPKTIAAIDALTSGVIGWLGALAEGLTDSINLYQKWKRLLGGAAPVFDLSTTIDELEKLDEKLRAGITNKNLQIRERAAVGFFNIEVLKASEKELDEVMRRARANIKRVLQQVGEDTDKSQTDLLQRQLELWNDMLVAAETAKFNLQQKSPQGLPGAPAAPAATTIDTKALDAALKAEEKYLAQLKARGEAMRESVLTPNETYIEQLAELDTLLAAGVVTQETYNRALAGYRTELDAATPGIQSLLELNAALTDSLTSQEQALLDVRQQMLDLSLAAEQFPDQADAIAVALGRLEKSESDLIKSTQETGDTLSVFAEQAARNMQDAFADFLFDPFSEGLDGMLVGFLKVIQRMLAEQLAAKLFGSVASGGFGGADLITGAVGSLLGGGIPGFAGGGSTGNGPRSGGLDGEGGFLAMMHPQEIVTDLQGSAVRSEGAQAPINVTSVLALNPESINEAMSTRSGAQVQINNVRLNRAQFRRALGLP